MTSIHTLAGGSALSRWIREGGVPDGARARVARLYRWRGFWYDLGLGLARRDQDPHVPPFPDGDGLLFIMGFWRSGTTILHELLASAPGWGAPRTWQCMDPLAAYRGVGPSRESSIPRPMDDLAISTHSPQEDEFALLSLGVPSPCLGFLDPRRLPSLLPILEPTYWDSPERGSWTETLASFLGACRRGQDIGMVVKSPPHVFRAPALARRFPKARFVWILRDPLDVWLSNLKMWKAMVHRYGLWDAPEGVLETFLDAALQAYRKVLVELEAAGTLGRSLVLSYEELVANPSPGLRALAGLMGLDEQTSADWRASAMPRLHSVRAGRVPDLHRERMVALEALRDLQQAILAERQPCL